MIDLEFYWGRVEFAPGRGQIHCHLLAIMKDKAYLQRFYDAKMDEEKVKVMESYAMENLGMSANIQVIMTSQNHKTFHMPKNILRHVIMNKGFQIMMWRIYARLV